MSVIDSSRVTLSQHGGPPLAAAPTSAGPAASSGNASKPSRLWLWFVAVFALQLGAWGTWFVIASQNKVAEVPLATSTTR